MLPPSLLYRAIVPNVIVVDTPPETSYRTRKSQGIKELPRDKTASSIIGNTTKLVADERVNVSSRPTALKKPHSVVIRRLRLVAIFRLASLSGELHIAAHAAADAVRTHQIRAVPDNSLLHLIRVTGHGRCGDWSGQAVFHLDFTRSSRVFGDGDEPLGRG